MTNCNPPTACILEDTGVVLFARVELNSGDYITQSDFGTITYIVKEGPTTIVSSTSLTVADVVSDTLVTNDARWTTDTTGYNFVFDVPYTAFPTQGTHRVVVTFTPSSGNPVKAAWFVSVEAD